MAIFKIIVPKVGSVNEFGTESKLYVLDEIFDAKEPWQISLMDAFVANNWAVETKIASTADIETTEPVRADDAVTPDVSNAYKGAIAPKKVTAKRSKKTTKKKAS